MSYNCKILLDSISETGKRLTTFEITFPRIVLAEFNTHRVFSRNSASSRAIPFKKQVERIKENPFIPEQFPINGKGMQPNSYIYGNSDVYVAAKEQWLHARDKAINEAEMLYGCLDRFADINHVGINIHKQIVNRLLEPFIWHTVIITATEFDNFFKLRYDENAQYEIKRIADLMYDCYHCRRSDNKYEGCACSLHDFHPTLKLLKVGEWHCPLVFEEDWDLCEEKSLVAPDEVCKQFEYQEDYIQDLIKKISVARCARVSYLTHDGKRDIEKDLELFERLKNSGHWSPFEHVATPYFVSQDGNYPRSAFQTIQDKNIGDNIRSANFVGWKQYRKEFSDENCTNFRKEN